MRDPIPKDRELLMVMIKSQFMSLSFLLKVPFAESEIRKYDEFFKKHSTIVGAPIPDLRGLAYRNAIRIFNHLTTGPLTGSF